MTAMPKLLPLTLIGREEPTRITNAKGVVEASHVFDEESIHAVNAALACGRPLLVRGEPGTGKSQLARAAAQELGRVYLSKFVDARTEAQDLLWFHDAVTRLADAQVLVAPRRRAPNDATVEDDTAAQDDNVPQLDRARFTAPGPLWWALNWTSALGHVQGGGLRTKATEPDYDTSRCDPEKNGVVLLIDEIDKADTSVPNGLLECLGNGRFSVPGFTASIEALGVAPLIVLTTNEDRVLPDAFIRRCVVLHLRIPDPTDWQDVEEDLESWLATRGQAHFKHLSEALAMKVAEQVVRDRHAVRDAGYCPPGLAEYIDLLRVLAGPDGKFEGAEEHVRKISRYFLHKHADPRRKTSNWADIEE